MRSRSDVARQALTLTAAIGQAALPVLLMPSFPRDEQPPDVMQPADYAFAVWGPIFATSVAHGLDQARPSRSADLALRATGWPLAAGYACTAAWAPLVATRRHWAAQAALGGVAAFSEVARRRVAVADQSGLLGARDRLVLVPSAAMLAAWGSAAATVNLTAMLVGRGVVPPGRAATALGTAGAGAAGALLVTIGATTPGGSGTLAARLHAATSLWALAGVAVGQRARSRPVAPGRPRLDGGCGGSRAGDGPPGPSGQAPAGARRQRGGMTSRRGRPHEPQDVLVAYAQRSEAGLKVRPRSPV